MTYNKSTEQFAILFPQIYKAFHKVWDPVDTPVPSPEALAIMMHLTQSGPLSISEASQHFKRSLSAMSEIIKRIIKQGWVEKIPDKNDRRIKYIWLTQNGEQILERASQVLDKQKLDYAFKKLKPQTQTELIRGLEELLNQKESL